MRNKVKTKASHKSSLSNAPTLQRSSLYQRGRESEGEQEVPPIVYEVLRSPGQPLDAATRALFEPRFEHDFSHVRVHMDAKAAESARAINALAYTVGKDVVFGAGEYAPGIMKCRQLLAHELTHVLQQEFTTESRDMGLTMSSAHNAPEYEAEQLSLEINRATTHSAALGERPFFILPDVPLTSVPAGRLHRQMFTPLAPGGGFRGLMERDRRHTFGALPEGPLTEEEIAEAGLIALANMLQGLARETEVFRNMYNQGASRIEAEIMRLRAAGIAEGEIAKRAAAMRHALAEQIRQASGTLLQKGAETFDAIRGNIGRPTYETLRAAGKTNAQIIASASKTNRFANRLPTGLRWTGRGLWVVSAGISVYVIVSAPEEERARITQQEIGGLAGGAAGTALAEGICIAFGIATEGIGLIACGLLGGLIGFEFGRRASSSIFEEMGRGQIECLRSCEGLPWYLKGFCMQSCVPGM